MQRWGEVLCIYDLAAEILFIHPSILMGLDGWALILILVLNSAIGSFRGHRFGDHLCKY